MSDTEFTSLDRAPGLPADNDPHHYFGFDQQGNVWALTWSHENSCWTGVGFDGAWPATRVFRGDAAGQIVSTIKVPISSIPTADAPKEEPAHRGGLLSGILGGGSDASRS